MSCADLMTYHFSVEQKTALCFGHIVQNENLWTNDVFENFFVPFKQKHNKFCSEEREERKPVGLRDRKFEEKIINLGNKLLLIKVPRSKSFSTIHFFLTISGGRKAVPFVLLPTSKKKKKMQKSM